MPGDKRSTKRKSLKYPARIDAGDGSPPRDCVLIDVSETGARVILKKPDDVPEQFTLLLGTQGAAPRHCRVVWREGPELGLEFRKTTKPTEASRTRSRRD